MNKIPKPKVQSNNWRQILPFLPNRDLFFDSRHWVYGYIDEELPFAVTTRISANNQQFLLLYEKDKESSE